MKNSTNDITYEQLTSQETELQDENKEEEGEEEEGEEGEEEEGEEEEEESSDFFDPTQIRGQPGWCNGIRVHPYALETAYQWLNHFTYVKLDA